MNHNDVKKLNKLVHPFLDNLENELNKWSVNFTKNDHSKKPSEIPFIQRKDQNLIDGVIICGRSDEAFNLQANNYGVITNFNYSEDVSERTIVIRRIIKPDYISKYAHTVDFIKPFAKEMLDTLELIKCYNHNTLNEGYYAKFKLWGEQNEYFRLVEGQLGLDFRLHSNCTKLEN